ncbi:hypothetical protein [Nocardioides montaniterrae]
MSVITLTKGVAKRVARAIVHPIETTTEVAGSAAGAAGAAADVMRGAVQDLTGDARRTPLEPVPPAPQPDVRRAGVPTPPPVATEPKPADVDDWHDEMDDLDELDDAEELPRAPIDPDVPLIDPGAAKAVRSESETLRRAAERDPADES